MSAALPVLDPALRPRVSDDVDHTADEIRLYVENDARAWHDLYLPALRRIDDRRLEGRFDPHRAIALLRKVALSAAARYEVEFETRLRVTSEVRAAVAFDLLDRYVAEVRLGNTFWR